ncbi:MAG TPA: ribonuclease Z [Bacteroidales bacterium]|jgi:ribonuclease Z|nr:ribonuclease Z [Bacteroidales bacterium]MCZ2416514.1 ribonuclease Z [Burkholderiales bacterium]OQC58761.1 MAG: Ribonuclease BN [Bacteroidetes bacterium ADurb.Bin013]MBP8999065.1 ribonuclease Z [Bacteroidales bacterium]MBV6455821.1 Ribonuclease BN [Bacteroidales bacterium]
MPLTLTSLGSASALPARNTYFTAHVLNIRGRSFLLDCGEGTQLRLGQLGISLGAIDHVFITHLHADHVFGLLGMISSMHLLKRNAPLYVHAPRGLEKLIEFYFDFSGKQDPSFPIIHKVVEGTGMFPVMDGGEALVSAFPLNHGVPTFGYLFREKRVRKSEPRSVAYCTDTAPFPELAGWVEGVDLLFLEATFLEKDLESAQNYKHCTARQAAQIALDAGVGKLLLGHFSSRYKEAPAYLAEAREIFPDTELSTESRTFSVPRRLIAT